MVWVKLNVDIKRNKFEDITIVSVWNQFFLATLLRCVFAPQRQPKITWSENLSLGCWCASIFLCIDFHSFGFRSFREDHEEFPIGFCPWKLETASESKHNKINTLSTRAREGSFRGPERSGNDRPFARSTSRELIPLILPLPSLSTEFGTDSSSWCSPGRSLRKANIGQYIKGKQRLLDVKCYFKSDIKR